MKAAERQRVLDNRECLKILHKSIDEITQEEKELIRENYSGYGSILKLEGLAQFFTPKAVSEFVGYYMNEYLPPNAKVLEPSVGSGNLLAFLRQDFNITTMDIDENNHKILSVLHPEYENIHDSACNFKRENYYDAVIANPPFNINVYGDTDLGYESLKLDKVTGKQKGNSDAFFIEQTVKSLKVGGYGFLITPSGVGYKSSLKKYREMLLDNCWIITNIELPETAFAESGTTIKTHILIFRKAPKLPKFKCSSYDAIEGFEFILGQPPIIAVQINDMGHDKKGRATNLYDETSGYKNQMEECFKRITDDLEITNICPENSDNKELDQIMYWKESNIGYYHNNYNVDSKHKTEMVMFEIQTLGRGKEIEFEGVEYETRDWGVMDQLVEKYKSRSELDRD